VLGRRVLEVNQEDYELFARLCEQRPLDECFHIMLWVFEIMLRAYGGIGGVEGWLKERLGKCRLAVYAGQHGKMIALDPPEKYNLDLSKLPPMMMKVYTKDGECYYVVFPEDLEEQSKVGKQKPRTARKPSIAEASHPQHIMVELAYYSFLTAAGPVSKHFWRENSRSKP